MIIHSMNCGAQISGGYCADDPVVSCFGFVGGSSMSSPVRAPMYNPPTGSGLLAEVHLPIAAADAGNPNPLVARKV